MLTLSSTMTDHIRQAQAVDQLPQQQFLQGTHSDLVIEVDGLYRMRGRVYVPSVVNILQEAHHSRFTVHPGTMKMYHDLYQSYLWPGLKKDVLVIVTRCLVCHQVKIEH